MVRVLSLVVVGLVSVFLIVTLTCATIGVWRGVGNYILFRDLLTIILAVAGVSIAAGGYLVYRVLEGIVERRAESKYSEMRSADEAQRLRSTASIDIQAGYTYWLFYQNTGNTAFRESAIQRTERAYFRHAVNLDEEVRANQLVLCIIKNNLAYYYAERHRRKDRKISRDYAEYIYNKISIFPDKRDTWEDTYNFVMSRYP